MKLLRIDSSARKSSVSRKLTEEFVDTWKAQNPEGEVIERDLASTQLAFVTDEWVMASHANRASLTPAQQQTLSLSHQFIDELRAADTIVIGAPMYNFSISAPLKAWIDQVVRFGQTWTVNGSRPQGLLEGKKVIVLTSRGGAYRQGTPTASFDFQEPYLRHVLGFIGLTDVTFVHAENQKPGELAAPAYAAAIEQLQAAATETNNTASAVEARA
jgi:FMN-dependent NADH-azoreductase